MTAEILRTLSGAKPLAELFNAMYRGKRSVSEFAQIDVAGNCERKTFSHNGKSREVVSPNEKLRGCHEFIRLFLLDFLPIEEQIVFSYRKGVSTFDAVARHAESRHFFVTDIANFFPSIKRARIRTTLETGRGISPIADLENWIDRITDLVSLHDELPVGFSTSPAISNASLRAFDQAVHAECKELGLVYTRYSDDLIISSPEPRSIRDAPAICDRAFREVMNAEFALHKGKSKFLRRGAKIKLLGMVLLPNGLISVDAATKSDIEVLIHFYIRDKEKFAALADGDEQKAEARLSGLLNHVNTVDQSYLDKLRRKFGTAVVDRFIHRSFG